MINADAITPSDTVALTTVTRGLYVGVTGDVKVTFQGQATGAQTVILKNLLQGVIHLMRVTQVWDADTTATDIVAMR
jgi:hypothetical protein